ncbi:hypothetical protein ACHAWU_006615 [Discostella pseudostelligera]|uniref:Uncharacterized protein n=1 Tax=Discostella pseudostelligera TaxID=259834 RepID=A0ABD3M8Y6_9STRA
MRHRIAKLAVVAAIVCCIDATIAFSFCRQKVIRLTELQVNCDVNGDVAAADDDDDGDLLFVSNRKEFISKVVAAASAVTPILVSKSPAFAAASASEPTTRIELTVDTEYLIRVLEYFDGDMRKVLGVLIRAPTTSVEIEPPSKGNNPNLSPKDAILRALYSYKSPEDYVTQASWLKVDEPEKGWVEFLTKKRYKIYLPSIGADGKNEDGVLEVTIQSTNINLSNLEAAVGVIAVSYPLAYGYYNYESFIEEKDKAAKKKQLAAKNAAKGGAVKKAKKNANNDDVVKTNADGETQPPVLKGQATTKDVMVEKQLPTKGYAIDEQLGVEVLDLRSEQSSTAPLEQPQFTSMPTNSEPSRNELRYNAAKDYSTTIEQKWTQPEGLGINELEQLVAAAAQNQFKEVEEYANTNFQPASGPDQSINELEQLVAAAAWSAESEVQLIDDNFSENLDESMNMPNNMETNNLRSLVENMKPRRGPMSNNYLDTL